MSDITAVSPSDLDIDTDIDSGFDITNLPESFKRFLKDNDIDPRIYTVTKLPRFVRWNSHLDQSLLPTLDQLREQLKTQDVWKVQGLDGFFGFNLVKNGPRLFDIPAYKDHSLFGIDLSSAVAVEALCIEQDDHVLDVCCAPGAKLCMIANIIGQKGTGTVTGVDLAPHRLATCQSLLKKYRVGERARLFAADGTQFAIPAPSRLGSVVLGDVKLDEARPAKRRKTQKKAGNINPFWAPRMLRFDDMCPSRLYDKVLVDAECTHDGSISHIIKYEKWGWDTFEKNFMDKERLATISELQRNLMKQGWKMLKDDGLMVYSTCSLTIKQNEDNVAWFLAHYPDATLENVPCVEKLDIKLASIRRTDLKEATPEIQDAIQKSCVRFDPLTSRTSGFFLARFRKSSSTK